jgi:UPF0716 protein FxsA
MVRAEHRFPEKMNLFTLLLALFLVVPVAEIWVMLQVGHVIGAGWTILLILATAVAGSALVRAQGLSVMTRVRSELDRGVVPATEMVRGMLLLVAGALLLTPGFITDTVGLVLLLPPAQYFLVKAFLRRAVVSAQAAPAGEAPGHGGHVIDGSFRRESDRD